MDFAIIYEDGIPWSGNDSLCAINIFLNLWLIIHLNRCVHGNIKELEFNGYDEAIIQYNQEKVFSYW
ncbi:hypothetical protein RclHR1_00470019 [Rhizophagus clarus]|nr:hypothetical protein RclHR1_00470019 [Rhizophagus clarus]